LLLLLPLLSLLSVCSTRSRQSLRIRAGSTLGIRTCSPPSIALVTNGRCLCCRC
jgi:hypothetical protein